MAFSELSKRICRYFLHRVLGPFFEDELALDQLALSFDEGKGVVQDLELNGPHLNQTLAKHNLPFKIVDGFIGKVTIHLPIKMLSVISWQFNSGGFRIEIANVEFTLQGRDDSKPLQVSGGIAGSLLTSLTTAAISEGFEKISSQSLLIDDGIQLEGLDQLAAKLESLKVKIEVTETIIRLEPSSPGNCGELSGIELYLPKAVVSLANNEDRSKRVKVAVSGLEIRADTSEHRLEGTITKPCYVTILRIPEAWFKLASTADPISFSSTLTIPSIACFVPGPNMVRAVVALLSNAFRKQNKPTEAGTTSIEAPRFVSCLSSLDAAPKNEEKQGEVAAKGQLTCNIHAIILAVAYNDPPTNLKEMASTFFSSLPSEFSATENYLGSFCQTDCLTVQFLGNTLDLDINKADEASTLPIGAGLATDACLSVSSVVVADFELKSKISTRLICFDDSMKAYKALTFKFNESLPEQLKEISVYVDKGCRVDLNLSLAAIPRIIKLASTISEHFKTNSAKSSQPKNVVSDDDSDDDTSINVEKSETQTNNDTKTQNSACSTTDDFMSLSGIVQNLPVQAACCKLAPSVQLEICHEYLAKPPRRPHPLNVHLAQTSTQPVLRFTFRAGALRFVLKPETGDALKLDLIEVNARFERFASSTGRSKLLMSFGGIKVSEYHHRKLEPQLQPGTSWNSSDQTSMIFQRLVAPDIPKVLSAPLLFAKISVFRKKCDVHLSIQPIELTASMSTIAFLNDIVNRLKKLSPSEDHGKNEELKPASGTVTKQKGVYLKSFIVQPDLLLEANFLVYGSIGVRKCRFKLPKLSLPKSDSGPIFINYQNVGDTGSLIFQEWITALRNQWLAALTGFNDVRENVDTVARSAASWMRFIWSPFGDDSLPLAVTRMTELEERANAQPDAPTHEAEKVHGRESSSGLGDDEMFTTATPFAPATTNQSPVPLDDDWVNISRSVLSKNN